MRPRTVTVGFSLIDFADFILSFSHFAVLISGLLSCTWALSKMRTVKKLDSRMRRESRCVGERCSEISTRLGPSCFHLSCFLAEETTPKTPGRGSNCVLKGGRLN